MKTKGQKGVVVRPVRLGMEPVGTGARQDDNTRPSQRKRKRLAEKSQGTVASDCRATKLPALLVKSRDKKQDSWQDSAACAPNKLPPQRLASDVVVAGRLLWAPEVMVPSSYLESHHLEIGQDSNQHARNKDSKTTKRGKRKKQLVEHEELQSQVGPLVGMRDRERVRAELLTSMLLRHLHRKFAMLCAAEGLKGKQHASIFERWHFASRVEAETSTAYQRAQVHPCLPWLGGRSADRSLLDDLRQAAVSNEAAQRICHGIRDAVGASVEFASNFGEVEASETCLITVVADGANTLTVSTECTIPPRILKKLGCDEVHTVSPLRISRQHYDKLRSLFDRSAGQSQERSHRDKQQQDQYFHIALFCLLERYRGIKGSGFQAALPGSVFVVLLQDFGACVECFASPLNCRYGRFCSGFFDCDVHFGSLGSFFRFCPRRGSFQANPPFVPQLINAMSHHMRSLLVRAEAAEDALSFTVIVGASAGLKRSEAWQQLIGSDFLSRHFAVQLQHHRYKEGAQHFRKKKQVRMSSCDTSVFFLQTKAASAMWPVTEEKLSRLALAFRS